MINYTIKNLDNSNVNEFKEYCKAHRKEHDESFLYDEDLDEFKIGNENPTCLLYGDKGVEGVCSIIQDEYHLKGKRARVRIFHCSSNRTDDYRLLFDNINSLNEKVEKIIMFVPIRNTISRNIIEEMGFVIERFSYIMERTGMEPLDYSFPDGYELTDYIAGRDEEDYMHVRNIAFSTLRGSEVPLTKEQVISSMKPEKILKGGAKILRYYGSPVGIIRVEHEVEQGKDYTFVAPLAILPEHQGKGLGSNMLRAGIKTGFDNGYTDSMLTVNVENENALKLYFKEGFKATCEVACYNLKIR